MRKVILLALFLFVPDFIFGQTEKIGFISGQVTEKISGRPIENVAVSTGGFETKTDALGRFRLEIQAGSYNIAFKANGFAEFYSGQVTVTASRTFVLNAALTISIEQVVVNVESGAFESKSELPVSQSFFNRDEIRVTPGGGGDPLRAINSLPAVTVQSGQFADLIVRGGSSGENLTFIDNIPIADFTLFTDKYDGGKGGRATFLPPDVFSGVDFSAGGFGVKYGDRMSSVLDVKLREPNKDKLQGVLFVDSGGAGLSFDTPIGKKGGMLTSIRRSYIDVAFDLFDIGDIGRPRNWDIINRGTYEIDSRNKLSFTALNLFENYTLTDGQATGADRSTDALRTNRRSRRGIFGITLTTSVSDTTLSQFTAWGNIRRQDGGYFRPNTNIIQRARDFRESEFGFKEEATSSLSGKVQLAYGGALIFNKANYFSFEKSGAGYSPLEEEYLAPDRSSRLAIGNRVSAYAYGHLTWRPTERFSISPQIRFDRIGLTDETYASPRLNVQYRVSNSISVNFASGTYRQSPDLYDLSISTNRNLTSQQAVHVVGGVEWIVSKDVRLRAELFRKSYSKLVVRPVIGALGPFTNSGSGKADGLELALQKSLSGRFAGQISYSFVNSERRLCDGCTTYPAEVERPHQLILLGITRVWGLSVGAKFRAASGLPYSRRTPVSIGSGRYVQRIATTVDLNALRLPVYRVFDMRIEKKFDYKRWSIAPYMDIFNVFASNESTDVTYFFTRRTPRFLNEGSRIPIIGMRLEF